MDHPVHFDDESDDSVSSDGDDRFHVYQHYPCHRLPHRRRRADITSSSSESSDNDGAVTSSTEGPVSDFEGESVSRGREPSPRSLIQILKSNDANIDKANALLDSVGSKAAVELERRDGRGNTALHYAAKRNLLPWVEMLHKGGANLNAVNRIGLTPLHCAILGKCSHGAKHSTPGNPVEVVQFMLSKGASPIAKDWAGKSPLVMAITRKDDMGLHIIQALVPSIPEGKIDERVQHNHTKTTALNVACQEGRLQQAKILLESGACPLEKDAQDNTPLFNVLVRARKSAKYLRFAWRFVQICSTEYDMKKILTLKNNYDKTCIHEVVKSGDLAFLKTCIRLALGLSEEEAEEGKGDSFNELLDIRSRNGQTLMHIACKNGHLQIIGYLHAKCPALLNTPSTAPQPKLPIHYACKKNLVEVVREVLPIMSNPSIRIDDLPDMPSLLKKAGRDALFALLDYSNAQPQVSGGTNPGLDLLLWAITNDNSSLVKALYSKRSTYLSNVTNDSLDQIVLSCAAKGKTKCLQVLVEESSRYLSVSDDQGNTILHLAARGSHSQTVAALLKSHASLEKRNQDGKTPLHLAVEVISDCSHLLTEAGPQTINMQDNQKMTALMLACRQGNRIIVKNLLSKGAKLLLADSSGLTCLDHAIASGDSRVTKHVLSQPDWRGLMEHCTKDLDGFPTTPMRKLIVCMPDVAKYVLDRCITRKTEQDGLTSVVLDYRYLEDWFAPWMRSPESHDVDDVTDVPTHADDIDSGLSHGFRGQYIALRDRLHRFTHSRISNNSDNFDEHGKLRENAQMYVSDSEIRNATHPLKIMADSCTSLLCHPVVAGFRTMKWRKLGRGAFAFNLFLYTAFLVFLTGHLLIIPPTYYILADGGNSTSYTWLADGQARWQDGANHVALFIFGRLGGWIVIVLSLVNFLLMISRIILMKKSLLNAHGLFFIGLELTISVLAILLTVPISNIHYLDSVNFKLNWQWECGAISLFFAWLNFIVFLRRLPLVGVYVLMVELVFKSFLQFALVLAMFIFAYAVSFYVLLNNQTPFHNMWYSLAKTLAMTSGEVDFGSIVQHFDYLHHVDIASDFLSFVFYPLSTNVMMAVFIIIMPILISNLLTGLAVDDVAQIRKEADDNRRILQVNAILDIQNSLPLFFWRRSVLKQETLSHLRKYDNPVMIKVCKAFGINIYNKFISDVFEYDELAETKTQEMKLDDLMEQVKFMYSRMAAESMNDTDQTADQTQELQQNTGLSSSAPYSQEGNSTAANNPWLVRILNDLAYDINSLRGQTHRILAEIKKQKSGG